jgi:hypothetical protein
MTSNGKTLNYKIVDLVESYNFYIKFTSIQIHAKKLQFFERKLKTEIWIWKLISKIVYWLFDYEDDFKWKNFVLQSCRSRRKLHFSYKVYLHPSSNEKLQIFKRDWTPTTVAHGGRKARPYLRPPRR